MGRANLTLFVFLLGSMATPGAALPPPVLEVPTVTGGSGLKSGDFSGSPYIVIDDYATTGDAGGGYFTLVNNSFCNSGTSGTSDDGGVTLQDGAISAHCFLRRFTGAVHLRWYGVTNATMDATTQLRNAMTAATQYGNGCVDLDGLRVHIGSASAAYDAIVVPKNVTIGCDDAPVSGFLANADFSSMPNALVLYEDATTLKPNPATPLTNTSGITKNTTGNINVESTSGWASSGYAWIDNEIIYYDAVVNSTTIDLPSPSSQSRGQLGTSAASHQQFSVLHDVPLNWTIVLGDQSGLRNINVLPQWSEQTPPTTLRGWLDSVLGKFYGEALRCAGDGCDVENVNILGFDTGFEAVQAPRLTVRHLTIDANNCYWLHGIGGENQGGDVRCYPLLTHGGPNTDLQWTITSVGSSSGACQITVTNLNQGHIDLEQGDTVWVDNVIQPQGCNGRWIASTISAGLSGTVVLAGSSYSGPTTPATWSKGSNILTLAQAVTGATNASGLIRISVGATTHLANGDIVTVSGVNGTTEANGSWPVANVSSTTFDLVGSTFTHTYTSGGTAIWPGQIANVYGQQSISGTLYPGQYVCASGSPPSCLPPTGIPSGTTVVSVWPALGEVILSKKTTAASSGYTTVELLNVTSSSVAGSCNISNGTCLSVYSSERYWTYNQAAGSSTTTDYQGLPNCIQPTPSTMSGVPLAPGNCPATGFLIGGHDIADDLSSGLNFSNPFSYGHEVQYHLWNVNSTGLFGAGSDNHSELNDPNVVGFWFDGTTDRSKIDLRETHSNFADVLQNSSTSACNTVVAGEMDVDVANAHEFEVDNGCLILSHGNNNSVGVALVANAASELMAANDYMPDVTLYTEGSIAAKKLLGGASNVFAVGSASNSILSNGSYALNNGSLLPVWEYNGSNLVLNPDADNLTAVTHTSVADVTASINVVTSSLTSGTGVQLPLTSSATDLTSNVGTGGCIEIVNSTANTITVWAHNTETITNGSTPVNGNTGVSLLKYKTATFCPVSGTGWVGN